MQYIESLRCDPGLPDFTDPVFMQGMTVQA